MLSVVIPTYNESENVPRLLEELGNVLNGLSFEVVIVDDDSPDRTWELVEGMARSKPWLRVIRRMGKRGLSSAVVEGFRAARGDILAVIDSDGQHDPTLLPKLFEEVKNGAVVAIGSRYIPGGSVEGWARARHFLSFIATGCAWLVCSSRIRDPMSGFFAMDRTSFASIDTKLRPRGFKILLEILGTLDREVRVVEIPLVFRLRWKGESKLDTQVETQFFFQILSLLWRRHWILVAFCILCIGILGILIPRVVSLRLLYTDATVRNRVQEYLQSLSEEQGWIISDLSVREARSDVLRFIRREHRRGADTSECYIYAFASSAMRSCTQNERS